MLTGMLTVMLVAALAMHPGTAHANFIAPAYGQDAAGTIASPIAGQGGDATVGASPPNTMSVAPAPSVANQGGSMPSLNGIRPGSPLARQDAQLPAPDRQDIVPPSSARNTSPAAAVQSAVASPAPLPVIHPPAEGTGASALGMNTPVAATPAQQGIVIPSPPPPSSFATDPNQLAAQAEQAALQAQAQADFDEQKREQQHNARSFDKASSGLLPLAPDQIRAFMQRLEQTQSAAQMPAEGPPKGQVRIGTLSLDPGVDPPQINLASGYVTTITMVDATGEPWPILDVGVGGNFEVSPTQSGTHVVRIMPLTRVGMGDLSVLLKDLPTPVIFRLNAGGPTVDLRYDARIAKAGPGAKPQLIARPRLEAGDETLSMILQNAPPASAHRMRIGGLDARTKAWSVGDKVYVRTPLSLLSPAWNASEASADGMNVYEIGNAPVLLMSDNGAMIRAQISRDDDHDK